MTFGIAGLDVDRKADVLQRALWAAVGSPDQFQSIDVRLIGREATDPATTDDALSYLRVTVTDPDREKVGRQFSSAAVALALSTYPGFFVTTPPGEASAFAVYWPTTIPADLIPMRVVMGEEQWEVSSVAWEGSREVDKTLDARGQTPDANQATSHFDPGATSRQPLGSIAGARSGDKGGNANVGFWVRNLREYEWLAEYLTEDRLRALLPEAVDLVIERFELPNLLALNFVIHGLLGEGVSSSTRTDPQAKSLGEFLRARWVDVPRDLIGVGG